MAARRLFGAARSWAAWRAWELSDAAVSGRLHVRNYAKRPGELGYERPRRQWWEHWEVGSAQARVGEARPRISTQTQRPLLSSVQAQFEVPGRDCSQCAGTSVKPLRLWLGSVLAGAKSPYWERVFLEGCGAEGPRK